MHRLILPFCFSILIPVHVFAASIPQGASRVEMHTFSLRASCDADSFIQSITLKHTGLGDVRDIERAYIMEGNKRLSLAHSFSSKTQDIELRMRSFSMDACSTRILRIFADFSPDAAPGSKHDIEVSAVDARGGAIRVKTVTSPQSVNTVPASMGSIFVEYKELLSIVRFGKQRIVSRFLLVSDGNADQQVVAIIFTNKGSARDKDLRNIGLYDGEILLSSVLPHLDGDRLEFQLKPALTLSRNQKKLLTIKADVQSSGRKTIQFIVEEPSDIQAMRQQRKRENQ